MNKEQVQEILQTFIKEEKLMDDKDLSVFINHVQELSKRVVNDTMINEELDESCKSQIPQPVLDLAEKLSNILSSLLNKEIKNEFEVFLLSTHISLLHK